MRTEYMLRAELEHVLSLLMPQNRLIMRLMLHTGMRLSDALELRPEAIKPTGWYTERKTGKRRRYGIQEPLLSQIRSQMSQDWAFPGRVATRHKTRQAVWRDVKRAAAAVRLPQNVGPHSARKIYAVALMAKYGDIERVRRNLNHGSAGVTAIYAMADHLLAQRLKAR